MGENNRDASRSPERDQRGRGSLNRRDDRSPQRGSRWRSRSRSRSRRRDFRGRNRRRSPPKSPDMPCGGSASPSDGEHRGYREDRDGGRDGGRGRGGGGRGRGRRSHQREDDYNQGGKERWGKPGEFDDEEEQLPDKEPEPDFGLSGALAAETNTVK